MTRKIIVSLVLVAVSLGGAALFARWLIKHRPEPARQAAVTRAPLVETMALQQADVRYRLRGFGTARCDQQATLTAEVAAPVLERINDLEEGVAVEKGQVLIRLDDRWYQQELTEAQAMLAAATAESGQVQVERANLSNLLEIATADLTLNREELARVEKLYKEGNAPKTEYDDARLAYQNSLRAKQDLDNQLALLDPRHERLRAQQLAAQARNDRAELNIERCAIKAPFAGRVDEILVEAGDRVQSGSPLLTLVELDEVEVPLALPVSDRPRTRVGAPVDLSVESMPDVHWAGEVVRIGPVADERSRTFTAYVEVDNTRQSTPLLPGYFVKAVVEGPVIADALAVPRNAVIGNTLFVANGNHAHERHVNVEHILGDEVVLSGDVRPGDAVIISNLDLLFDGAVVRLAGDAGATSNGEALLATETSDKGTGAAPEGTP
ncbi:MAG TPA: efflux RND transporter periplasmic adaptor subunit [Phycisphaerae bacterium]|nr:efflux RND transporter periplasmic adaptor subunit [Phycisphaerae bacterium]